ncbi:MAG: cation:proton antiporter [Hyphomicrobiaceae bacterium]
MAATFISLDAYSDALVVLGTAGIVVPLVRHFGLSPVLGYLGAGALLGPLGLGTFMDKAPWLYWVTVVDPKNVSGFAELGIVFLLFLIGLELSYQRLVTMRRLVFGLGTLQVVLCTSVIAGIAMFAGSKPAAAVVIGACLALSSTAIVIEVLSNQRRLSTTVGRTSFSILLAQDIAVVPILLFVSFLGNSQGSSVMTGLVLAVANAALAIGVIVAAGRLLLQPLLRLVASVESSELFVAAILFVIVGSAVAAGLAGLSMALGAFVAGLLLSETEFRKAIETTVEPFKGLLLGLFFFTVGMNIDLRELAREPFWLFASVFGVIAIKAALIAGLARLFRTSWASAVETGLLLGPGGEFAFVIIGVATGYGLVTAGAGSFTLAVTSITMALIPVLASVARRLTPRLEHSKVLGPELTAVPPPGEKGHAIVIGHGRVGQIVCDMLERHRFPFVATDRDTAAVTEFRRRGREVYYGNAAHPAFLKSCGIMDAGAVIVTIHDQAAIDEIVQLVRSLKPDMLIVSRARDATHARHLYAVGVNDAVPETIEASLQLSEAALVGLGLPAGPVIASIHEKRDEFRHELQEAAGLAGQGETRSIRAKTLRR